MYRSAKRYSGSSVSCGVKMLGSVGGTGLGREVEVEVVWFAEGVETAILRSNGWLVVSWTAGTVRWTGA